MPPTSSDSTTAGAAGAPSTGTELPKAYRPSEHEGRIRDRWFAAGAFSADPGRVVRGEAKPYSILIPPPNVTARLHLGHALNNTLQDVLTRAHRMMGYETLWMPGTDHAGIATQAVVERRLKEEEGKVRRDFTREAFVARVQAWKDDYEKQITDQLKLMGCSCDFDRQRFTMDEICARAVREAFFQLFKDGLIYRGKRLVNWDPALQTAVADDECFEEEVQTSFWYLRYPLVAGGKDVTWGEMAARGYPGAAEHKASEPAWVTVATTRPETYLADTAVALNPNDPRLPSLKGLSVRLPIVGRVIPIIDDSYVVLPEDMARTEEERNDPKAKYATGFLKVTPGHDENDYQVYQRHKDAIDAAVGNGLLNMMSPDGRVSDKHGWTDVGEASGFVGLTMAEARKAVVSAFKERGLLEAIKPYTQTQTFSDRSKAQVEPYLSDQWYVRVTDPRLAASANAALVEGQRSGSSGGPVLRTGPGLTASQSFDWRAASESLRLRKPVEGFEGREPYPPGKPSPADLISTIRNLPHVQLAGATYFVTWRSAPGVHLEGEARSAALEALRHFDGDRMTVHAACVMPNHVHAIVRPKGDTDLNEWVASVKRFSARKINQSRGAKGSVWQDEHFDHIVRDLSWFETFVNYIVQNPVAEGIVERAGSYDWTYLGSDVVAAISGDGFGSQASVAPRPGSENRATKDRSHGDGEMRFVPSRYAKTFEHWHENIRDWCISRQLWWGHRIPVWRGKAGKAFGTTPLDKVRANDDTAPSIVTEFVGESVFAVQNRIEGGERVQYACTSEATPEVQAWLEKHGFTQDPDVLDTWFSSALWPLSTMGWPDAGRAAAESGDASMKELLAAFNPTSTLCTAREIITLWVSRMTMFNRYFRDGAVPFRDVYIHAVVQDGEGQKMSKSLGNGVDPIDIIETHGSDAMRFTLCQIATQTQDVRLPVDVLDPHTGEAFTPKMVTNERGDRVAAPIQEYKGRKMVSSYGVASGTAKPTAEMPVARNTSSKFDFGRNFANKMWNASRFTLSILDRAGSGGGASKPEALLADAWILSRLARATEEIGEAIRNYEFANYAQALYRFIWDDFCDWYLEAIKPTVAEDARQRATLAAVLRGAISLAHPVMPFITEVIWEQLSARLGSLSAVPGVSFEGSRKGGLLCTAGWPTLAASAKNEDAERRFDRAKALITGIREVRAQHNVPPKRKVMLHVPEPASWADSALLVQTLAGVEEIRGLAGEGARVRFMFEGAECALSNLADAVDAEAERARLAKLIADKQKSIATLEGRLANPGYAAKAPPAMVKQTQDQLSKDKADLEAAQAALAGLGG